MTQNKFGDALEAMGGITWKNVTRLTRWDR